MQSLIHSGAVDMKSMWQKHHSIAKDKGKTGTRCLDVQAGIRKETLSHKVCFCLDKTTMYLKSFCLVNVQK